MTAPDDALFVEWGARWRTLAWGPLFCLLALVVELTTGPVVHWIALAVIAVVLMGFTAIQIVAARRHVTVILTADELTQGTENVAVADIAEVYPEPDYAANGNTLEKWQSARVLGELSGVPRGRTAVGLRLRGQGLVQAWAKDDETLREHLDRMVQP
ncbi:hypothetical protein ACTHQY_12455 [Rhodococcoides corynebacterioides]|uniref:hypothetical protein n=1 Tax=Rhodococcoides corynebacterioides TaxID=53972 RepID=UPI003F7D5170